MDNLKVDSRINLKDKSNFFYSFSATLLQCNLSQFLLSFRNLRQLLINSCFIINMNLKHGGKICAVFLNCGC